MKVQISQYLNIRSAVGASISHDGKHVVFLSNIPGVTQAYRTTPLGGWPHQITFFPSGVQFVDWAPNSKTLIAGADKDGNEKTQLFWISYEGEILRQITDLPRVIHSFGGWSHDGNSIAFTSNQRDERFFDVYVQSMAVNSKPECVLQDDATWSCSGFSPDGTKLLLSRANASLDADLYTVELSSKTLTHLTPHEGDARIYTAEWSTDGLSIVALTDIDGREFVNIAEININSKEISWIIETDHDIESLIKVKNENTFYYDVNKHGYSEPHIFNWEAKSDHILHNFKEGSVGSISFTNDGKKAAISYNRSFANSNVYYFDINSCESTQLTFSATAGIPPASFIKPELIQLTSFDGLKIDALYYRTASTDKKAPLILSIHGGPESQERPIFNPLYQFFIAHGYSILAPNIRGSTGYGKTFTHLDDKRKRWDALADISECAAWCKKQNDIDPEKIIVMGGSYGGFACLASLVHYPEIWAAGIDIVGISHFGTFLKNTGPWRVKLRACEYGDPIEDADFFEEISPLNHVKKIKAPLMVIQGANDPRVPKSEADQMVAEIQAQGGVVEYLVFEDEGHGVAKLPNRIICYEEIVRFLDEHVKNKASLTAKL